MKKKIRAIIEKGSMNESVKVEIEGLIIPSKEIPILINFSLKNPISIAHCFKENGCLKADFEIEEDICLDLYPSIGFQIIDSYFDSKKNRIVTKSKLMAIGLSPNRNSDSSINILRKNNEL